MIFFYVSACNLDTHFFNYPQVLFVVQLEIRHFIMGICVRWMATLAVALIFQATVSIGSQNQSALLKHLFDNYQKAVRPMCGKDEPIDVMVGFAVRQIIELDEPKQILYLNAWLRLKWYDCQLQWDGATYDNITKLVMPYDQVWAPDITLYDNAAGELPGLKEYRVLVENDGTVSYNFPTVISVLCKIDVSYFPFDTQKCPLKFGSWAHHGMELNVTNRSDTGDISSFVPNSEFDITSMPLERNVVKYGCCPETYPDVTFYVYMKRKPMFYVLNLLFPCIIITSVSLLGFLLPPEAGEKVSLEITVLLSLAVFLLVVSETLPPTSETIPYIGIYFASAMVLVSLSTVLTVVVLNVHHKEYKQVPRWMRIFFLHYTAKLVFFKEESAASVRGHPRRVQVQGHSALKEYGATGLPNGFLGGGGGGGENGHANGGIQEKSDHSQPPSRPPSSQGDEPPAPLKPSASYAPLLQILNEQLRLMKKADARKDGKQRHDLQSNEWRCVAIVLDRLFLLLFILVSFITSMVVLVPLANR
ncbi:neuronal acetylcholine receptor subunit alpha-10-like [Babylonia areolata]|uniref:neuronal acetylcholine receptor subunit alpha-10-like n=1 Tax=Babylonia areolata TaxID=304850 RepID=UPI003FD418F9